MRTAPLNLIALLLNLNLQGIQNKISHSNIALLIEHINPYIISFTEHWLNKANQQIFNSLEDYRIGSICTRSNKTRGGVCILIRE